MAHPIPPSEDPSGLPGLPNWWPLEQAILRQPGRGVAPDDLSRWGYYHPVTQDALTRDHRAFEAALSDAGVAVSLAQPSDPSLLDAVFATDAALPTRAGMILLAFGKALRRAEVALLESYLVEEGIPIAGRIDPPGTVEGGDCLWLDERTLLVGEGYRTNPDGIDQLCRLLPNADVIPIQLPHAGGPAECLHLQSLMSFVRRDLVVAHPPLMPVRLVQLLESRGIARIDVPPHEYATLATNALCLREGLVVLADRNPITAAALRSAGVRVVEVPGDALLRNGSGGPTCLTLVRSRRAPARASDPVLDLWPTPSRC